MDSYGSQNIFICIELQEKQRTVSNHAMTMLPCDRQNGGDDLNGPFIRSKHWRKEPSA